MYIYIYIYTYIFVYTVTFVYIYTHWYIGPYGTLLIALQVDTKDMTSGGKWCHKPPMTANGRKWWVIRVGLRHCFTNIPRFTSTIQQSNSPKSMSFNLAITYWHHLVQYMFCICNPFLSNMYIYIYIIHIHIQ